MKSGFLYIPMIAAILTAGCTKDPFDRNVHTKMTPPPLVTPLNNMSVKLDRVSNATVLFDWDKAQTADYTLSYYKLQIDKESGDFSAPLYTAQTDSGGIVSRLQLTHQQLNKIAANAGIAPSAKGKLKWRVYASNGVEQAHSAEVRVIELERPAGSAGYPNEVYISGSATEAGTDISKAIKLKKTGDGVFEIYTSLTAGTYHFVNTLTGTPESYVIDGNVIGDAAEANSPVTTPKVYRIVLDFNTGEVAMAEIKAVGLWFAFHNAVTIPLTYDKSGTWQSLNTPLAFANASWGKDERYKFQVTEVNMQGVESVKYLGYSAKNSDARPTSGTAAAYYYLLPVDNSQWDYTYKLRQESTKANIYVKFGTGGAYTHEITY
ncbi:SusE domain-containing protein [uncultured Chitinophaga sp.]|uniref:SusE domain-containing protein n=1 Tax=uncultured Chitinophaga sp. TaxID=339340 RepID=UPI0025F9F82A|nr:SusE domain-containing protein [uncultured Chitinophaga sp.]